MFSVYAFRARGLGFRGSDGVSMGLATIVGVFGPFLMVVLCMSIQFLGLLIII